MNSYAKLSNATENLNAMMHERLTFLSHPKLTSKYDSSKNYIGLFRVIPPILLNYFHPSSEIHF